MHYFFPDVILVAGGTDGFPFDSVEALKLSAFGPDFSCPGLSDMPEDAYDMQGLSDDAGRPMFCGGFGNDYGGRACFVYNADADQWVAGPKMTQDRDQSATVKLTDGRYWVTGGFR